MYFGDVASIKSWYQTEHNIQFEFMSESDDEEPEALAFYDATRGIHGMIFSRRPSNDTIAHECSHVARMILNGVGIEQTASQDESYAYYIGFLVRGVGESLKEIKKRGRAKKKPAPKKKAKKKT